MPVGKLVNAIGNNALNRVAPKKLSPPHLWCFLFHFGSATKPNWMDRNNKSSGFAVLGWRLKYGEIYVLCMCGWPAAQTVAVAKKKILIFLDCVGGKSVKWLFCFATFDVVWKLRSNSYLICLQGVQCKHPSRKQLATFSFEGNRFAAIALEIETLAQLKVAFRQFIGNAESSVRILSAEA